MSLYLKYRSKTISELDLAQVRETLSQIIQSNTLSHAYLFTGPRGSGKTSAARILARVVNCEKNQDKLGEPCNTCDNCRSILTSSAVDVIEVDAASNRGIDDVRELKEKIRLSPSILPKKVYIIDEVHMMTTEAFNALLKTLEEPPKHSLFVLCTTEAHKVPETISSRCTRVLFTKATVPEMQRALSRVVTGEGAKADEEALAILASSVDGSFRDGIKILDQLLASSHDVSAKQVEAVLYGSAVYDSFELARALVDQDLQGALDSFHKACSQGVELTYLLTSLMQLIRDGLLASHGVGKSKLVVKGNEARLIGELDMVATKLASTPVPDILVEVVIIEWCKGSDNPTIERTKKSVKPNEPESPDELSDKQNVVPVNETMGVDASATWTKLMGSLNGDSYSLGALLSKARPGTLRGNELTIEVQYEFHREQIMAEKFRARIESLITKIMGQPVVVRCQVNPGMNKLKTVGKVDRIAESDKEEEALLAQAQEIFNN